MDISSAYIQTKIQEYRETTTIKLRKLKMAQNRIICTRATITVDGYSFPTPTLETNCSFAFRNENPPVFYIHPQGDPGQSFSFRLSMDPSQNTYTIYKDTNDGPVRVSVRIEPHSIRSRIVEMTFDNHVNQEGIREIFNLTNAQGEPWIKHQDKVLWDAEPVSPGSLAPSPLSEPELGQGSDAGSDPALDADNMEII